MARWTLEEIKRLRSEYPVATPKDIDRMVRSYNRRWETIMRKANLLGLRRQDLSFSGRAFIEEIGNVYGSLTVLRRVVDTKRKSKGVIWECRCVCGSVVAREGGQLRRALKLGQNPHCGCGQGYLPGESAFNAFLSEYKRSAKKREHTWNLTKAEFKKLIYQPCFYCGREPSALKYERLQGGIVVNGIDRIDNSVGYRADNCHACCAVCNKAKGTLDKDAFLSLAREVYLYRGAEGVEKRTDVSMCKVLLRAGRRLECCC